MAREAHPPRAPLPAARGASQHAYAPRTHAAARHKRKLRGKDAHPQTPDINLKASKRCWAGMVGAQGNGRGAGKAERWCRLRCTCAALREANA